jgi:hypothetical protein
LSTLRVRVRVRVRVRSMSTRLERAPPLPLLDAQLPVRRCGGGEPGVVPLLHRLLHVHRLLVARRHAATEGQLGLLIPYRLDLVRVVGWGGGGEG